MRKRGAKIGLIAIGLIAGFFIAEISLRALVRWSPPNSSIGFVRFLKQQPFNVYHVLAGDRLFRKSRDSDLVWELVPKAQRGFVRINSAGFRGEEVALQPRERVRRIAVLGDSETFGERLPPDETISGSIQNKLQSLDPEHQYEVLNFGVVGYNTAQEFVLLKKRVMDYHPTVVVLYYVFNDPEIYNPVSFVKSGPLTRIYLYQFFQYSTLSLTSINDERIKAGNVRNYFLALHSSVYFDAVKSVLREMSAYLQSRNIPFFLLIAPEIYEVKDFTRNYPYREIHQKLRALDNPRMRVVDPLSTMARHFDDPQKLWVTPYDQHKNAQANLVIAEVLSQEMIRMVYPK